MQQRTQRSSELFCNMGFKCNVTIIEIFVIWVNFLEEMNPIVLSVGVVVLAKAVSCN